MAWRTQECKSIYGRYSTESCNIKCHELLVLSRFHNSCMPRFWGYNSLPMFDTWVLESKLVFQRELLPCSSIFILFSPFLQVILIPTWVGQVFLLLGNSLTAQEQSSCALTTGRAYNTFQTGINGVSAITGANTLDIASIGIDLGLSTSNITLVSDAYARIHSELVIKNGIKADGIRADGSFGNLAFL